MTLQREAINFPNPSTLTLMVQYFILIHCCFVDENPKPGFSQLQKGGIGFKFSAMYFLSECNIFYYVLIIGRISYYKEL